MPRRWAAAWFAAAAGFSMVETSAVLAGTSLLTVSAAPQIQEYIETARKTKAAGDVRVLALSILRLSWNVGTIGRHQPTRPTMLVGDGETPLATLPAAIRWTLKTDDGAVQSLGAHLVDNAAGYTAEGGAAFRWRGPYLEGLSADPWGWRYAVNVGLIKGTSGMAVFVISAGPNGEIETPYEMVGLKVGGDDLVGLIGSGQ